MADAILYCDYCGRMLQPAELSRGQAIATSRVVICSSCAARLSPEERAALAAMARSDRPRTPVPSRSQPEVHVVGPSARPQAGVRTGSGRLRTPTPSARLRGSLAEGGGPSAASGAPEKKGSATLALAIAGIAAGAAVGVAVVLLVSSGPAPAPPPGPPAGLPAPAGPMALPAASVPTPAPAPAGGPAPVDSRVARARLEAIRSAIDPSLGRYDEIRSALVRLQGELAGAPEGEEAGRLLAELDSRHAEIADAELRSASEAASDLVRRGRFEEAASVLNSLRPRFGGSPWFAARGEKEIAQALERIAEARSAKPERPGENVFSDGSFDVVDGRGVPSGWSVPAEWVAAEGTNRWLRLTNDDPKGAPNTIYRLPVDPAWETLKVSARMRAKGLKPGRENWHTGRVALRFEDARNEMVGQYGPVPELKGDSDWVAREVTMTVPQGAHHLSIQPGIFHAVGTVEIDDIRVVPVAFRPASGPPVPAVGEKRPEPAREPPPEPVAEAPEPQEEPWPLFLVEFVAAARAGSSEAKALVERESARLAELGFSERLAQLRSHLREAELVQELALDALRNAPGMVRLQRQGRPLSGKVVKVEGGLLVLKPSVGDPVEIPISEIAPEDLVQAAGLLRLGSVEPARVARYLLARGQIEQAKKLLASEPGPKALALREELEEIASAISRAEAKGRRKEARASAQASPVRPAAAAESEPPGRAFALRVNCGPNQHEVDGWQRDDPWVRGGADFTFGGLPDTTGLSGAAPAEVYRTCRHQNHSYDFSSVPNGTYTVRLHFYDEHGQGRRMVYTIEGAKVLDGFSTRAREAVVREFTVTVSDGNGLQILAEQGDGNDVFECGIEILSAGRAAAGGYVQGLLGEYFQGTERDPAKLKLVRIDPQLDFDWKTGSPAPEIPPDQFSARWTGEINVPADGRYEFQIRRDNGFALWIGGKRIFEKLDQGHGTDAASAELEAGWQPFRVEFLEGGGDAYARLSWKGPGFDMKTIPPESFRTRGGEGGGWSRTENFDAVPDGTKASGWSLAADWRIEKGALVSESSQASFAAPLAPNGKAVRMETTLTVEATLPQDGHKLAGPAIYLDDRNFWGMALVEAPDGKRYVELLEMLDGSWAAQYRDPFKLSTVVQQGFAWEPARPYRLRLEMDSEGIAGTFSEPDGSRQATIRFRFDNRAVTSGRPALRSGGFRARFDDFSAKVETDGAVAFAPPPTPPLPKGPKEPLPGENGEPGQWASGLVCELFSDHQLRNRIGVRVDRNVDSNFGDAPVDLEGPADNFAARWSGFLLVPQDGQYTVKVDVDDEARVVLDGRTFLSSRHNQPNQPRTLELARGLHPITVTMFEYGGGASCRLSWQTPLSGKTQTIPEGYFYHMVPELGEMGPFARLAQGLWAEYFATDAFDRKLAEGPLEGLEFDLGDLPPHVASPKDRSAVRIRGYVLSRWSKNVKFEAEGGGVRLRVGGQTVIDSLKSARKVSGTCNLTVGYHEIEVDYVDLGDAKLALRWEVEGMRSIDSNLLFHKPRRRLIADRSGLAPGLLGRLYAGENPGGKAAAEFLEPSCTFDWSGREPAPGVPKNRFSGAWRGMLVAPQSGQYAFMVKHSGGVALTIGGTPVVNKWSSVSGTQIGSIALRAGKAPLVLTYFNREGDAKLDIWWSGPLFGFRRLSSESLAHQSQELPMAKAWGEPPAVAAAPAGGARPAGQEPRAPASEKEKPEPMPAGNLVANGGFEEMSEDGRFAARWTAHQWGPGSPAHTVRIDRGNARQGDRALLVQATGEGALPGAFAPLAAALPAGSYVLRFWACADVGKSAQVHANVAGRDLGPFQVGEDWKEIVAEVELTEKKLGTALRLWTSSQRVKVWFDDVSLEARPGQPSAR